MLTLTFSYGRDKYGNPRESVHLYASTTIAFSLSTFFLLLSFDFFFFPPAVASISYFTARFQASLNSRNGTLPMIRIELSRRRALLSECRSPFTYCQRVDSDDQRELLLELKQNKVAPPALAPLASGPPRWRYFRTEYALWILAVTLLHVHIYATVRDLTVQHEKRLQDVGRFSDPWPLLAGGNFLSQYLPSVLLGRDDTDGQWRQFTRMLPLTVSGFLVFALTSNFFRRWLGSAVQRWWRCLVGFGMVLFLHGRGSVGFILVVLINFAIVKVMSSATCRSVRSTTEVPSGGEASSTAALVNSHSSFRTLRNAKRFLHVFVWVFHLSLLFFMDFLRSHRRDAEQWQEENFYAYLKAIPFLDLLYKYDGVMGWYYMAGPTVLRMISFDFDCWQALESECTPAKRVPSNSNSSNPMAELSPVGGESLSATDAAGRAMVEDHWKKCIDCITTGSPCQKLRSDRPHPSTDFTLNAYFTYLFYPQLYVAGPIISFNAFRSYEKDPQSALSRKELLQYVGSIIRTFLLLQILMHYYYFNAIKEELSLGQASVILPLLTISDISALGLFGLAFLWLKFTTMWRFFRAMALLDGINPPENMKQCFCNVHTAADFWQNWHASINLWAIRYLYVPLGGYKYRLLNVFPIFAFIALWHDINLKLVIWALIMCVFIILESAIIWGFSKLSFIVWLSRSAWWRGFRTVAVLGSVFALIAGNAIGFGTGSSAPKGKDGQGSGDAAGGLPIGSVSVLISFAICMVGGANIGVIIRDNRDWISRKVRQEFADRFESKRSVV
jgi:D-alanyl-lipoteichoic acid acyltransferase DltB (MBOAT superfamily)